MPSSFTLKVVTVFFSPLFLLKGRNKSALNSPHRSQWTSIKRRTVIRMMSSKFSTAIKEMQESGSAEDESGGTEGEEVRNVMEARGLSGVTR